MQSNMMAEGLALAIMRAASLQTYYTVRLPNRHPRCGNLCFVGASTHSGTGMPTALVSARLASQRMIEEAGSWGE